MNISQLSGGKDIPREINVFIEIPYGSVVKYEFDEESEVVKVDRFMSTTMRYPFNYGFMPHTYADDGDPLDVLVMCSHAIHPGAYIATRPVGVLEMEDEDGVDHKILAVPTEKIDPFFTHINDITDVNQNILASAKHFFEHYKDLEKDKWVKVREFKGKDEAFKIILESQNKK